MKKLVIILIVIAAVAGVAFYSGVFSRDAAQAAGAPGQEPGGRGGRQGGAPRGGAPQGGFQGGGRGNRGPLTVEIAKVTRGSVSERITVVGNLIGDATVSVVPRVAGRLQAIYVKLGDRVGMGQRIAKIEDFELQEQVKQAEAAQEVSQATIRQREADLQLALTNAERSRNLFARQLLPKQTLDDTEARYQSAIAQLDLARAQNSQSKARLDELHITLANTVIVSPVNGFVARRGADPGAFVSQNAPIADVVDISRVRLVANIVEKDLRQIAGGDDATVEVDAFPGEQFTGRIARVSPVLDPATRTASIEIEIPNPGFRLKPGMYARVGITTNQKKDTLVVPINAIVDLGGRRGVFVAQDNNTGTFRPIRVGIEEATQAEVLDGVTEGEVVVTTGAGSVREGERFIVAGARQGGGGGRGGRRGAGASGAPQSPGDAAAPAASATPRLDATPPTAAPEGGRRFGGRGRRGGGRGQRAGEQQ